jgi:glucose/mannose-6-phosphate isomerase
MGWEGAKVLAKCNGIVLLRERDEPVEIRSRIEVTKSLIAPLVPKIFEVWAQGKSELAKMLSTILVGDFASVYMAMLRKVDPTPVKTVDTMKEQVEKNGVKKHILQRLEELSSHA